MEVIARISTKLSDPIFNSHRDPRKQVYFWCDLVLDGDIIADSVIYAHSEKEAIASARSNLAERLKPTIERLDYHPMDFESHVDGWGQRRVREPEDAERLRKIYDEAGQ